MSKKNPAQTSSPKERAFLVGVELRSQPSLLSLEDSLEELALLADTAGLNVIGEATQRLDFPNSRSYIGSGKIEEIKLLVEDCLAEVIIFDNELSPRHLRELEKEFGLGVRVIDRTALILDIFAQHANTREGILQVQLAQFEYRLPRLTRAWTHLARQSGGASGRTGSQGGVGLRGPGETQLEVDRREISRKITNLKQELEKIRAHRALYRSKRKKSQIPVVALVGYTNAGKSTFLNHIAQSDVYVANQLFATLDPTTRRVTLPGGHEVLFTDTVGFIQKLPTQLIAAFRATLEEISEADLLLQLVDITHPNAASQWKSVTETLHEIDAVEIPTLTILNKIDQLPSPEEAQEFLKDFPNAYAISALTGDGVPELLKTIEAKLYEELIPVSVRLPYTEGNLIAQFHDAGQVIRIEHERGGVRIDGNIPGRLMTGYQPFFINKDIHTDQDPNNA